MDVYTDEELLIAKLRGVLVDAPEPTIPVTPEWMLRYTDWYYRSRNTGIGGLKGVWIRNRPKLSRMQCCWHVV